MQRKNCNKRLLQFLLSSVAGMFTGISGEYLGPVRYDGSDLAGAILLSPFLATFFGAACTIPFLSPILMISGLVYIPVYILLLVLCLRKSGNWQYVAVYLWCVQGHFQLLLRMHVVMSTT